MNFLYEILKKLSITFKESKIALYCSRNSFLNFPNRSSIWCNLCSVTFIIISNYWPNDRMDKVLDYHYRRIMVEPRSRQRVSIKLKLIWDDRGGHIVMASGREIYQTKRTIHFSFRSAFLKKSYRKRVYTRNKVKRVYMRIKTERVKTFHAV